MPGSAPNELGRLTCKAGLLEPALKAWRLASTAESGLPVVDCMTVARKPPPEGSVAAPGAKEEEEGPAGSDHESNPALHHS